MPEREKNNPEERDFTNQDEVIRALERGIPEELERLKEFHSLSQEQLNLYTYYARLRRKMLDEKNSELAARSKNNPRATEQEMAMGAYTESIEPQVRDVVSRLRSKGYNTTSSGFFGLNSQEITIANDDFLNIHLDEELEAELRSKGVVVQVAPNKIHFTCTKELTINEIESIWHTIESVIPNLGRPVGASTLPSAETFRRKLRE